MSLHPSRWYDKDPTLAIWLERLPLLPESVLASLLDSLTRLIGISDAEVARSSLQSDTSMRWYDADPQLKVIMQHLKTSPIFVQQSAIMVIRQAWCSLTAPVGTF